MIYMLRLRENGRSTWMWLLLGIIVAMLGVRYVYADNIDTSSTTSSITTSTTANSSSASSSPIVGATSSAIAWPTEFAQWTQGKKRGVFSSNLYGYMVDSNNLISESKDGNNIYLKFNLIAFGSWDKSQTKFYILSKTNDQYSGKDLSSDNVTINKVASYSRSALWEVKVNIPEDSGDEFQLCMYDNSSTGFYETNGVADDSTYKYMLISPVIGWHQISVTRTNVSREYYVGESSNLTFSSPAVQGDSIITVNNNFFKNASTVVVGAQTVDSNVLKTSYTIYSDAEAIENQIEGLLPLNNDDYGLRATMTYNLPSAPQKTEFFYGGLRNIVLDDTNLSKTTVNTKDYLYGKYVDTIISDIGSNLTYTWYYATSDNESSLKEVGKDFSDTKNSTGILGSDWMSFPENSSFLKYVATQNSEDKKVYLMIKIRFGGDLKTLTNPILVQIQTPTLKVPDKIDFGTIPAKDIYNGGSFESLTKNDDNISVSIPSASKNVWQVSASTEETGNNSIAKLNGQLNIFGKNLTTTPVKVASVDETGKTVKLPLNAKVTFKGYHNPLAAGTSFTEDINWNLSPKTTVSASE